eukprot:GEMP01015505.1.p1 GENE.GEMP01015505.1~~GEMP01015505.1.p1  ORF type:complete len:443 (+),score=56.24 GEMP01015505.1:86-1414(+)
MTYYSDDHGISYINNYIAQNHRGNIGCQYLPEKGRILLSNNHFEPGEVIFVEPPLLIVSEKTDNPWFQRLSRLQQEENFDYETLWYWSALNSLIDSQMSDEARQYLNVITPDQQHRIHLLYHDEVQEASQDILTIIEHFQLPVNPMWLETTLQIWILNCFEHTDDPLGYSTYFMSSFMSHSCLPCAVWHYEEDNFVLRARRRIEPGQEICCSYLSEDALLESTASRRSGLEESKHFLCMCERCNAEFDMSRGFLCPGCHEGTIFPPNEDPPESAVCPKCGRAPTLDEWGKISHMEKQLEKRVREWETRSVEMGPVRGLDEKLVESILSKIAAAFTQHWLVERLWTQAMEFYEAIGRMDHAIELSRRRKDLIAGAYPSVSGAHAWAWEVLGDLLRKNSDYPGAQDAYIESLIILRLMFGEKHEYYISADAKLQRIKKHIAGNP